MSIIVRCSKCEQPFKVDAAAVGRKFSCKSCGERVTVSSSGQKSAPGGLKVAAADSAESSSRWGAAMVASLVLFAAVATAAAVRMTTGDSPADATAGVDNDVKTVAGSPSGSTADSSPQGSMRAPRQAVTSDDAIDASTQYAHDFSTPHGAILCLEDAYKASDIEAAVQCRDFRAEAKLMMGQLGIQDDGNPPEEIVVATAKQLEAAYRQAIEASGFPDFSGVTTTLSKPAPLSGHDDVVQITEVCHYPDGTSTMQKLSVTRTDKGWRVITLAEK